MKFGVRIEDKTRWERRTPIVPNDAKYLKEKGIDICIESSEQRAFTDQEYKELGIPVQENLDDCNGILGIKEISEDKFKDNTVYMFFAHVIKGQTYNMPMLKSMINKKATLIDYEKIEDKSGRRLIFFGNYAGLAGMLNSLWALGERLTVEGTENPFSQLKQAKDYHNLGEAKGAIIKVANEISKNGIPAEIHPLTVGFAGYGNVSKGAQEIFDLLPFEEIKPEELEKIATNFSVSKKKVYKVIFKEKHIVKPKNPIQAFDLQDYYKHGKEKYENNFEQFLPHLSLLVNANYWDNRYPRLLTLEKCKEMWRDSPPKLKVIGDISCDPDGSIQCNVEPTYPNKPVYVYTPETGKVNHGFEGYGPVIMAVEILPTELPRESSSFFSNILRKYIPILDETDFSVSFKDLELLAELKRAVIVYKGELTPDYTYLKQYLH